MFGIILTSIYFVKYSLNGVGVVQMKLHGKIFRVISDGLFIFLLIHTAKSLSSKIFTILTKVAAGHNLS